MAQERLGKYPVHLKRFADGHQLLTESKNVERAYFGKRLEDLAVKNILGHLDTPYMRAEAKAYFWPLFLKAMLRKPTSAFSRSMIRWEIYRWRDHEELYGKYVEYHRLTPHLSLNDILVTGDVLREVVKSLPPRGEYEPIKSDLRAIALGAIDWIDTRWAKGLAPYDL
ncbi:hypothetical protein EON81_02115 [bacterium]|nr:MAG: hypothetical protein EON81_02115 [bacterium]